MQTHPLITIVSRLAVAMSITLAGTATLAAEDPADHAAHHPADAASAVQTLPAETAASSTTMGMGKMNVMDDHMKTMQALHQKFMAAKTAEERQAMMPEHMQAMKDAMGMMQGMSGMDTGMMGDMAAHHQMMEKRMEMMQSMMQMMMDRPPGPTGK